MDITHSLVGKISSVTKSEQTDAVILKINLATIKDLQTNQVEKDFKMVVVHNPQTHFEINFTYTFLGKYSENQKFFNAYEYKIKYAETVPQLVNLIVNFTKDSVDEANEKAHITKTLATALVNYFTSDKFGGVDKGIESFFDNFSKYGRELLNSGSIKKYELKHFVVLKNFYFRVLQVEDIMSYFTEKYGFKYNHAKKIIDSIKLKIDKESQVSEDLKHRVITIFENNPYVFVDKFSGITFTMIDKIALNILNINYISYIRVEALTKYKIDLNEEEGHCYQTRLSLLGKVGTSLEIERLVKKEYRDKGETIDDKDLEKFVKDKKKQAVEVFDDVIENCTDLRYRSVQEKNNNKIFNNKYIYNKDTYSSENFIADFISKRSKIKDKIDDNLLNTTIDEVCLKNNFNASDEQREAVKQAVLNNCFILTGSAGTGKSTTTKTIIEVIERLEMKNGKAIEFVLCAPTGMASKRLSEVTGKSAGTIHSKLRYNGNNFGINENDPLNADVVIVDEISMLGVDLFYILLRAIKDTTKIILVGDPNQLPSIDKGTLLYDFLNSSVVPYVKLTKIYRQSEEKKIITYAHNILNGVIPQIPSPLFDSNGNKRVKADNLFEKGYDCLFIDRKETRQLGFKDTDFVTKLYTEIVPKYYPNEEIQILSAQKEKGDLCSFVISKSIQDKVNPYTKDKIYRTIKTEDGSYQLRVGDRVINTRNQNVQVQENSGLTLNVDGKTRLMNGEIGYIESFSRINNKDKCVIDFNGIKHYLDIEQLKHVQLGYAVTIHKSQGSEFPVVLIMLDKYSFYNLLQRGLLYTAITRGKKLVVFFGDTDAVEKSILNNVVEERRTYLKELLLGKK